MKNILNTIVGICLMMLVTTTIGVAGLTEKVVHNFTLNTNTGENWKAYLVDPKVAGELVVKVEAQNEFAENYNAANYNHLQVIIHKYNKKTQLIEKTLNDVAFKTSAVRTYTMPQSEIDNDDIVYRVVVSLKLAYTVSHINLEISYPKVMQTLSPNVKVQKPASVKKMNTPMKTIKPVPNPKSF